MGHFYPIGNFNPWNFVHLKPYASVVWALNDDCVYPKLEGMVIYTPFKNSVQFQSNKKKKIQYTYAAFLNASMTYISFEDTVLLNIKGVVAGVKVTLWWVYKFFNGSVK